MADLNSLYQSGLAELIGMGPQALEDLLFNQAQTDIQRQAQSRAQQINENAFGRGLGLSTVNAYSQAENRRAQDEAIAKARVDASTAARQAQLAALAQAAGTAQQEANRSQQESQFRRSLSANKDAQSNQMLMQGLGALGGAGLGFGMKAFGPEAINSARGLFGLNPMYNTTGRAGAGSLVQGPGEAMASPGLSFNAGDPISFDMGGALGDFTIPSFDMPSIDFGSSGSFGNFDLGALDALDPSNFSFNLAPLDFAFPSVDPNWDWSF